MTHNITRLYQDEAGVNITSTAAVSASGSHNVDETIADGQTHKQILDFAATRSTLKSLCIYSSAAITIKTNSTSDPDDTIAVSAGQVILWTLAQDTLAACPFTVDVTALYITNASGAAATVKIRLAKDVTA